MKNTTITTTTKNTPKTTTKNNTTTINTARTTTSNPVLSTIFTTTTDLTAPTNYNNSTEKIDIAGQIIKEAQQEITFSPVFIPAVGLLFALIPVFFFCLCYTRCWKRKKPKQIV